MMQTEKKYQRWENICLKLADMGYATRRQLQLICNLGGDRNAGRILLSMERDKLIQSERREQKVYYLTHRGKEMVGSTSDIRTGHMEHTLMRNDLYIRLGMPESWQTEVPIQYSEQERIICDALYMKGNEYHFVEVDHKNTMKNNYDKIKKYAIIKRYVFKQMHHTPTVIFYTVSENRKEKLEACMQEHGVKGRVYC